MPRLRLCLIGFGFAIFASPVLRAQITTPQPLLVGISPAAVQVGVKSEVRITGTDLDGATRLHFSVPGVISEPKLDEKKQPVANRFIITVPAGTPATTCDVRVVARYGISNPRGFVVTPLPVAVVPDTASTSDKAFAAPLNSVLAGAAAKQTASFIRFDARQGQRIIAVCRPLALDSRMDPSILLRNAEGLRMGRLQPDGLLDFTAPADGPVTLEVHDLMFRGDTEYPYVLTLTTGPVIEQYFDAGKQWTLYGRNLPKGSPVGPGHGPTMERLTVSAEEGKRLLAANPVRALRFGKEDTAPEVAAQPVVLQLPARHIGWFAPRGQPRDFTFEAKKGEAFWIEVNCARKGVAADPFMVVEKGDTFIAEANDRAAVATRIEFEFGTADPSYRFVAKEDGTYRVKLRNQFAHDAQEPFELTVRAAGDDYELVAIPSVAPKAKAATTVEFIAAPLWRGGVAVFKVFALRQGGFTGAIELSADGLPPDVKFLGGFIREGQNIGYASFYAEETAQEWAGAVNLHGKDSSPAHGATLLFKVGNTARESTLTRLTDELPLSVTPAEAPVTIEAASPVFESDGSAKISIPLKVIRRGDCMEALKLTSLGVEGLTADIAAKATDGKLAVDVAKLKLPAGDHPIVLQAVVKFKHRRGDDPKAAAKDLTFLVHSKPVIVRIKPVEKKA